MPVSGHHWLFVFVCQIIFKTNNKKRLQSLAPTTTLFRQFGDADWFWSILIDSELRERTTYIVLMITCMIKHIYLNIARIVNAVQCNSTVISCCLYLQCISLYSSSNLNMISLVNLFGECQSSKLTSSYPLYPAACIGNVFLFILLKFSFNIFLLLSIYLENVKALSWRPLNRHILLLAITMYFSLFFFKFSLHMISLINLFGECQSSKLTSSSTKLFSCCSQSHPRFCLSSWMVASQSQRKCSWSICERSLSKWQRKCIFKRSFSKWQKNVVEVCERSEPALAEAAWNCLYVVDSTAIHLCQGNEHCQQSEKEANSNWLSIKFIHPIPLSNVMRSRLGGGS